MPPITRIAHVELSGSDLDATVAWYCRLLSRTVLAFTQHDTIEGGAFTPHRVGLDHVSFAVSPLP